MPPIDGTNIIAAGILRASHCASWPAPLGMRICLPGACRSAAASSAFISPSSISAGVDCDATRRASNLQRPRDWPPRPVRCSSACSLSSTAGSASRNWNSASAPPGMMLWPPGSSVMRPVVHTVRGPADLRKLACRSRRAAAPARGRHRGAAPSRSCRRGSARRVTVMRYCQIATIAVTTPILSRLCSSVSPCSMCASKNRRSASVRSCRRGRPA